RHRSLAWLASHPFGPDRASWPSQLAVPIGRPSWPSKLVIQGGARHPTSNPEEPTNPFPAFSSVALSLSPCACATVPAPRRGAAAARLAAVGRLLEPPEPASAGTLLNVGTLTLAP